MEYNKILKVGLGALMTVGTFTSAFAQAQVTFTGTVVDETDIPIIGAAVRIAGQTQGGTITDLDGKFTIKVPQGGAVEISYIGYSTLRVTDFSQVKIVMKEDTQQLDEVVVVGYGVQKKAHLTGAISTGTSGSSRPPVHPWFGRRECPRFDRTGTVVRHRRLHLPE